MTKTTNLGIAFCIRSGENKIDVDVDIRDLDGFGNTSELSTEITKKIR
jgi:hypothetical protein